MVGRGILSYDGRRATRRHAIIDSAIARLREPPRSPGGTTPRIPATSVHEAKLVSADEFYARVDITPRTSISPKRATQPNSNAIDATDLPVPLPVPSSLAGLDDLVPSSGNFERTSSGFAIITQPVSATTQQSQVLSDLSIPPDVTATIPVSKIASPTLSAGSQLSLANQLFVPGPIAFGRLQQRGLAGSRWASPQEATSPGQVEATNTLSTPTINTAVTGSATNEVAKEKAFESSDRIVLRSVDSVKISNDSLPETIGVVRLVTTSREDIAILEIWINDVLVLDEELYESDTFTATGSTINFQTYSKQGRSLRWKMTCQLPYQSTLLTGLSHGRLRKEPRPLQEGPTPSCASTEVQTHLPTVTSSNLQLLDIETLVDTSTPPVLPGGSDTLQTATASVGNSDLLIDLDSEGVTQAQPCYVSPTMQALMSLMTDDKSIKDFLNRLNQPTGGEFLDQVFRIAGHSPTVGYSSQMLSAARTLVQELYIQSNIFQSLPQEITKSLVEETSLKVLEEALGVRRTEMVEAAKLVQADDKHPSNPTRLCTVYSADKLLSLRSRASTIEGQLICDKEQIHASRISQAAKRSARPEPLSEDSSGIISHRNLVNRPPAVINRQLAAAIPTSESRQISSLAKENRRPVASTFQEILETAPQYNRDFGCDPMLGMLQNDLQFQRRNSLASSKAYVPVVSCNISQTIKPTKSSSAGVADAVGLEEPLMTFGGQTYEPELLDRDLLVKFKALNLVHKSVESSVSSPKSATKQGESNTIAREVFSNVKSPPSILEICNVDLKGNPGLSASRWA
jgi:hypothetical protein